MDPGKPPHQDQADAAPGGNKSKKNNARYPSKTCKYAGVTFRASRDKYQARIYKDNKEYNLGLFDIAADAALAYDVAHRLMKRITASNRGSGAAAGAAAGGSSPGTGTGTGTGSGEQGSANVEEKEALESRVSAEGKKDWFDYGDAAGANDGLDSDRLNFLRPRDFRADRECEMDESRLTGNSKHKNCPAMDELRVIVRKESIRVTKIIVGASDGGTNNYRRKSKKMKAAEQQQQQVVVAAKHDGSMENPPKKRKKKKGSPSSSSSVKANKRDGGADKNASVSEPPPAAQDPFASAWAAQDDAFYQVTGLGRPVPNPSRTKQKEHPFGPPPVVSVGTAARGSGVKLEMMRHVGHQSASAAALTSIKKDPAKAASGGAAVGGNPPPKSERHHQRGGGNDNDNIDPSMFGRVVGGAAAVENRSQEAAANSNNGGSPFSQISQDTLRAGNVSSKNHPGDYTKFAGGAAQQQPSSYFGMGGGASNGDLATAAGSRGGGGIPGPNPENYQQFIKMRTMNMYPPSMGGAVAMAPNGMYAPTGPDGYQQMMFARAMGQNAGMYGGMGGMMGMNNMASLNQGTMRNGHADQQSDGKRQMETFNSMTSMTHNGIDRPTPNEGQFGNRNLRSLSPTDLNMYRAGGFPGAQSTAQSRAGGFPSAQATAQSRSGGFPGAQASAQSRAGGFPGTQAAQSQFRAATQQACLEAGMYSGDRYGQQLRASGALPGGQYGMNPAAGLGQFSGSSRGVQPSYLQAMGPSSFPSGAQFGDNPNVPGGAGGGADEGNPAFDC